MEKRRAEMQRGIEIRTAALSSLEAEARHMHGKFELLGKSYKNQKQLKLESEEKSSRQLGIDRDLSYASRQRLL